MLYKGQKALDIDALFAEIKSKPDATTTIEYNTARIMVESEKSLYIFTLPKHAVHPSVIIRQVVEEGGKIKIKTTGHTMADQNSFEAWLTKLGQADWQIKKDFNLKH